MEQRNVAGMTGWRSGTAQLGLIAVGIFSILILFFRGEQLIVAPGLLPVQWLIARHSAGWVSSSFAVIGSLLMAEVMLIGAPLLLGDGIVGAAVGVVTGLIAAMLFFWTIQGRR